jgi:hypothetical protein
MNRIDLLELALSGLQMQTQDLKTKMEGWQPPLAEMPKTPEPVQPIQVVPEKPSFADLDLTAIAQTQGIDGLAKHLISHS